MRSGIPKMNAFLQYIQIENFSITFRDFPICTQSIKAKILFNTKILFQIIKFRE
jgi:hypothetical protein